MKDGSDQHESNLMSTDNATTGGDVIPEFPERYVQITEYGSGGMSRVFRAHDSLLQKDVAIKVLNTSSQSDPQQFMRFQREAKITGQLKHPNIVSIYDFGLTKTGQPYLVMDLVTGESLADALDRTGALSVLDSMPLVMEILAAVGFAHSRGVLHRDIKPSNILLSENEDQQEVVKLIDFGIAKFADPDQSLTGSGNIYGSPAYMSPEQARGKKIDARSEVYSLACLFFEMWTGEPPFRAESAFEVLNMHCNHTPPKLSDINPAASISSELENLIAKCLEKDPGKRLQSVEEFKREISHIEELGKPFATTDSDTTGKRFVVTPSHIAITCLGLALIGVVAFMVSLLFHKPPAELEPTKVRYNVAYDEEIVIEPKEKFAFDDEGEKIRCAYNPDYVDDLTDEDLKELNGQRFNRIKIYHQKITGEGFNFINNPRLTNVTLHDVHPTKAGWQALNHIPAIAHLEIGSCNSLDSDALNQIMKLPLLTALHMPVDLLSIKDFESLGKEARLTSLVLLSKKPLMPGAISALAKSKTLESVAFESAPIRPEDLEPLRNSRIHRIQFSEVNIDKALMEKIADLPMVSVCFGQTSSITAEDLRPLAKSSTLKLLGIYDCPKIKASEVSKFKKLFRPRRVRIDYTLNGVRAEVRTD